MPDTNTPQTQKDTPAPKPAPKQNNVLSNQESESIASHLGKAIEHICGSASVLPREEVSQLAEALEQASSKLRGFCGPTPDQTATNWVKQLKSNLDADNKKRKTAENHIGEIQNSLNRSVVTNKLKGDTATKAEAILAKARKEVVGLLE